MDREQLTSQRVVVIGGGWSDEREISLESATEVRSALLEAGFSTVDLLDLASRDFVGRLVAGSYDVAFVALHGAYGEDGCIQGLLEILHIPYTFSASPPPRRHPRSRLPRQSLTRPASARRAALTSQPAPF